MKIGFIHYNWRKDGITTVMLNNVRGLRENYSVDIKLIGGEFIKFPEDLEICSVQIEGINETREIVEGLEKATEDCDVVVIENPAIGSRPIGTLSFKNFSEGVAKKRGQRVIWRHHDLIYDMPADVKEKFKSIVGDFEKSEGFARTSNVYHLTLVSFNKRRLLKRGLERVEVLPDSIVAEDFYYDKERAAKLRGLFENKGIIFPEEKALTYPSRILPRKNMSEAFLLTKILNKIDNYRLIITLKHTRKEYQEKIRKVIEEFEIPCSFGETEEYIGFDRKKDFTISDLYSMSELAVTTSVDEGFGYGFIEPWLIGIPLIGRDVPKVTEDFIKSGMNLEHLYGNDVFNASSDESERIEKIKRILRKPSELNEVSNKLDLESRIKRAKEWIEHNNKIIREKYDYIPIAKQFYDILTGEVIY